MPTDDKTFTSEQRAALGRYRGRWAAIRRSTEPADRGAAEEGIRLAYRAAGLEPPARLVWCDSPIALAEVARRASGGDGPNVKPALVGRLRRQVAAMVRGRIDARTRAQVESMVDPADALIASAAESVMTATLQENVSLLELVRRSYPLSWSDAMRVLAGQQGFRYSAIGQHELSWLGPFDYFRALFGLREATAPLRGLWQVAENLGWLQPHRHTCWLAERPQLLRGDARDRLHHADGPALRYPDGWQIWAWKGVEVPRWVIEQKEDITLKAIDIETNVQIRRCMIEIMTPERYVAQGGADRIAEDETGILWRKTWLAADTWAAVEVINATPEPDGTRKHFFLQVPAHIRTAREAVAWSYGLSANVYANLVMRT